MQSSTSDHEQVLLENSIGVVTNKRVIFNRRSGPFGINNSRVDISLPHVTSVRIDTMRDPVSSLVAVIIGVLLVKYVNFIAGIVLIILIVLQFLIGSRTVHVNTAGGENHRHLVGHKKTEANAFVESIRKYWADTSIVSCK